MKWPNYSYLVEDKHWSRFYDVLLQASPSSDCAAHVTYFPEKRVPCKIPIWAQSGQSSYFLKCIANKVNFNFNLLSALSVTTNTKLSGSQWSSTDFSSVSLLCAELVSELVRMIPTVSVSTFLKGEFTRLSPNGFFNNSNNKTQLHLDLHLKY